MREPAQTLIHTFPDPTFNQYDHGWIGNLKRYGNINPPAYDLSKVTTPVYMFHGANDYLATPKVY